MSMRTSFVYGYGFACDEVAREAMISFLKSHKETFIRSDNEKELYDEVMMYEYNPFEDDEPMFKDDEKPELKEIFECYSCDNTALEGLGAVISNIMYRETGIRFEYYTPDADSDTPAAVVFREGYPWNDNEAEKNLTEDSLAITFTKYMKELGLSVEPDYLELEYFG